MARSVPNAQRKIPRRLIVVVWVVIALLVILAALVELARGFHEGFSGF